MVTNADGIAEPTVVDADETMKTVGRRLRSLRQSRNLTLQTVAERTGLSPSLISMVERGLTGPSIGTLIALTAAVGVTMADLFDEEPDQPDPVTRAVDLPVFETTQGVTRRIVQRDVARGFELAINEYEPDTSSSPTPTHHSGYEYGLVIEGELTIEIEHTEYVLAEGDTIAYSSSLPHRLRNDTRAHARAVWVNFLSR